MYRILIVDDEQIEREGICFLIRKFDYPFKTFTKSNGMEGLEFLKTNKVDVICSDIKMPFMNGIEFCIEAKKLLPFVKIVLFTAFNDFEYTKEAIKLQVVDYLMKPIIINEFQDVIQKILTDLDKIETENQRKKQLLSTYKASDFNTKQSIVAGLIADIQTQIYETETTENISDMKSIQTVIEIINKEYTTDISLDALAHRVYLSKGYLSAIFKKETSLSVVQYITMLRMQKAQILLTQSSMKISDICTATGYHDLSYFCLTFKRFFGITAAKFRSGELDG